MVARRRSKLDIARALTISQRTVAKHLEHCFRKLNVCLSGVYSEAQVTAYIQQYRERFKAIESQLAMISEKLGLPYENPNDAEAPAEVRELARVGKRLEAVKRYRILTGASLDVAQDVVSKL